MNYIFSCTCWCAKLDVVVNDVCIIDVFEIGDVVNDVWWTTCKGVDVFIWCGVLIFYLMLCIDVITRWCDYGNDD